MSFNIVDFSNFIRSFMIDRIKTTYPELDTSYNSSFDDLFVKPMIEILIPLIDTVNSLEFKMNLENAEYMSEEDLDDIGVNNYLVERNKGQKSTTSETLSFTKISSTDNLILPAGLAFETDSGLKFLLSEKREFTPTELLTKYNPSTMTYDIDVTIEAEEVGTEYNVSENQITVITNQFNAYLSSVTNKSAVTNGIDKEDNVSYAARIRDFYISRHIGTKPGYKQFILENFNEVDDVYIAGYGDTEMTRDEITMVVPALGSTSSTLYMYHHGLSSGDAIVNVTRSTTLIPITVIDADKVTHPAIASQAIGDVIKKYEKLPDAAAETGTTTTSLKITAHGLSNGDYIRNVTRSNTISAVTVVDINTLTVTAITGQIEGDVIELYKFIANDIANIGMQDIHIGGKADIYTKGSEYETKEVSTEINTPLLMLSRPYSTITLASIAIYNINDVTKTPASTSVTEDANGNCLVLLNNTGDISYDPNIISQIRVSYNYDPGTGVTAQDDFFNVGTTKVDLESPFKSIVSIIEHEDDTHSYNTTDYYTIVRMLTDGTVIDETNIFAGTTQENIAIILKNMDSVVNGTIIDIHYTINQTLSELKSNFDIDENRIITTDLLFKEAQPVFVNVGFQVKMKTGQTLDDVKIAKINSVLSEYFSSLILGYRAEESDIVGYIYKNDELNKFIEFIALPLSSFYIPAAASDAVIEQRDGTYINSSSTQYLALNKTSITELT